MVGPDEFFISIFYCIRLFVSDIQELDSSLTKSFTEFEYVFSLTKSFTEF